MSALVEVIAALRAGGFVLVHDDKGREDEVDMVVAAEKIRPDHVATMREKAGGLLCLAIGNAPASKLGLVYMHDMIAGMGRVNPVFARLTEGRAGYGDRPSFSISINHRATYTGITDQDRALTIAKMAEVCRNITGGNDNSNSGNKNNNSDGGGRAVDDFANNFRAPGHVPILIASKGLLEERMGHTELCVYLMQLAGMTPAVAICEMMDSATHRALTVQDAQDYAKKAGIPLVDASELKAHARVA